MDHVDDQGSAGRPGAAGGVAAAWQGLSGPELGAALLAARWYARPNDLIGGWSVMPADEPPSSGIPEVGCFLGAVLAVHIARLHNEDLDREPAPAAAGGA